MNEKEIAEQCLCNMGIASGNIAVSNMKKNFSQSQFAMVPNIQESETEGEDNWVNINLSDYL